MFPLVTKILETMASDDESLSLSQNAHLLPAMSESPVQGGASGAGGSAAANLPIDDCSIMENYCPTVTVA